MTTPIPNCPQPETPIRERAWTAEQSPYGSHEKEAAELAKILDGMCEGGYSIETLYTTNPVDGDCFVARAADLLRHFAALRSATQRAANFDHLPEVRGWLDDYADMIDDAGHPEQASEVRAVVATLRQQTTNSPEIGSKLVGRQAEMESKVYRCPRCATSMQVDPSAKPRAPGRQGGRVDDLKSAAEYGWQHASWSLPNVLLGIEERQAALAQNAQEDGDAVSEDDDLAAKRYLRDWVPDSVRDYVAKLERHAERARVPDGIAPEVLYEQLKSYATPDCHDCDGRGVYYGNVAICGCVMSKLAALAQHAPSDVDKFLQHSQLLNQFAWRLANALGEVPEGAQEAMIDLLPLLGRAVDVIEAGANDASVAAIQFALHGEEGLAFLRCWNEGDFDACRNGWPEAPEACYVGAEVGFTAASTESGPAYAAARSAHEETARE